MSKFIYLLVFNKITILGKHFAGEIAYNFYFCYDKPQHVYIP